MIRARRWISPLLFSAAVLIPAAPGRSASRSPYGYLVADGPRAAVWWAEGAYKVMRDDPVPAVSRETVSLDCARNEYEPFLLVLGPKTRLDDVRVAVSDFTEASGRRLPPESFRVRHVEYVHVEIPTDESGAAGWWPDPLPPYDGPFTAPAGENHPLWITAHVPASAAPGEYRGTITLTAEGWKTAVPVRLRIRAFALPARPSIRSSFGMPTDFIRRYHNLETREELEKVVDLYYKDLAEHRVAPVTPFELYPIKVAFTGIPWEGGEFIGDRVHSGKRALKIVDDDGTRSIDAKAAAPVAVEVGVPYTLSWWARTEAADQDYTVLLEALNAEGRPIPERNVLMIAKGGTEWKQETLDIKAFGPRTAAVRLRLFPVFRNNDGTTVGTACFDDIVLARTDAPRLNLLEGGDFEMPVEGMAATPDFREFDRAARRYLDEFGFNSFHLPVEGLGTGSFYSRKEGQFGGFRQGTPEYDRLLSQYLRQVESHLAANGWLGKEYIYWFDEPDPKDYPFVREGMLNIRKNAPKLTRFITAHRPGPGIMDVSEIGCTIFDRVDPAVVADLAPKGREFWSYLCTGPKSPWVTLFIDHPAVNLRMWLWMSYAWGLKGILVWEAMYWNSSTLFPADVLQNPWADPMSYTVGYGVPFGRPDHWGNGDGRFLYPPNRDPGRDKAKHFEGPVDSVRWEILREWIDDYEYFVLLDKAARGASRKQKALADEARTLLRFPASLFSSGRDYTKDPKALLDYRAKVADLIEKFGLN